MTVSSTTSARASEAATPALEWHRKEGSENVRNERQCCHCCRRAKEAREVEEARHKPVVCWLLARYFAAVEELKTEFGRLRPIKRFVRRRQVNRLLKEDRALAFQYQRVRWELAGWIFLLLGALYALLAG